MIVPVANTSGRNLPSGLPPLSASRSSSSAAPSHARACAGHAARPAAAAALAAPPTPASSETAGPRRAPGLLYTAPPDGAAFKATDVLCVLPSRSRCGGVCCGCDPAELRTHTSPPAASWHSFAVSLMPSGAAAANKSAWRGRGGAGVRTGARKVSEGWASGSKQQCQDALCDAAAVTVVPHAADTRGSEGNERVGHHHTHRAAA